MLKDADPGTFNGIYIVYSFTDLRYSIDSLAAIIERKYHMELFRPNTLFLFCGHSASKIKGLLWEGDGFLLLVSPQPPVPYIPYHFFEIISPFRSLPIKTEGGIISCQQDLSSTA